MPTDNTCQKQLILAPNEFSKKNTYSKSMISMSAAGHVLCQKFWLGMFVFLVVFSNVTQAAFDGGLHIHAQRPFPVSSPHGYNLIKVIIENPDDRGHEVGLLIPGRTGDGYSASRHVLVPPKKQMTVELYCQARWGSVRAIRVTVDGSRQDSSLHVSTAGNHYGKRIRILVGRDLGAESLQKKVVAIGAKKKNEFTAQAANIPISEWSGQWLAYSGFHSIFLSKQELSSAPEPVSHALEGYVRLGGRLFVMGDYLPAWVSEESKHGQSYHVGLGRVHIFKKQAQSDLNDYGVKLLAGAEGRDGHYLLAAMGNHNSFNQGHISRWFRLLDGASVVNIKLLFFLLISFVLIVGPVNYYILKFNNRRAWMFWTVPTISFFFCAVIGLYAWFSEGFDSRMRLTAITFLDQGSQQAASFGVSGYYCPLTPADGLHFSLQTEAVPYVSSRVSKEINWDRDQHLSTGWVTARAPAYFRLRKWHAQRERIRIIAGEPLKIVNGLGASLSYFSYMDQQGYVYEANNVAAGAEVALQVTGKSTRSLNQLNKKALATPVWNFANVMNEGRETPYLGPGYYYTEMEESPFIHVGLNSAGTEDVRAVVIGKMEGAP